jgi:hypothetical protein
MHPALLSGKTIATTIAIVLLTGSALRAESQLQVVSPTNGALVNAGGVLMVTIKTPPSAFQTVSVVGDGPFALSTNLSAPPYQYSYAIPADFASGSYKFKAAGVTASGETVYSEPLEVDIEQPGEAKKLQSEYLSLTLGDQQDQALQIWAISAEGSKADVTHSKRMAYASDKPTVATVSSNGTVSPVAAGKARITVKYGDKSIVIPVVITRTPSRN